MHAARTSPARAVGVGYEPPRARDALDGAARRVSRVDGDRDPRSDRSRSPRPGSRRRVLARDERRAGDLGRVVDDVDVDQSRAPRGRARRRSRPPRTCRCPDVIRRREGEVAARGVRGRRRSSRGFVGCAPVRPGERIAVVVARRSRARSWSTFLEAVTVWRADHRRGRAVQEPDDVHVLVRPRDVSVNATTVGGQRARRVDTTRSRRRGRARAARPGRDAVADGTRRRACTTTGCAQASVVAPASGGAAEADGRGHVPAPGIPEVRDVDAAAGRRRELGRDLVAGARRVDLLRRPERRAAVRRHRGERAHGACRRRRARRPSRGRPPRRRSAWARPTSAAHERGRRRVAEDDARADAAGVRRRRSSSPPGERRGARLRLDLRRRRRVVAERDDDAAVGQDGERGAAVASCAGRRERRDARVVRAERRRVVGVGQPDLRAVGRARAVRRAPVELGERDVDAAAAAIDRDRRLDASLEGRVAERRPAARVVARAAVASRPRRRCRC